MKSSRLKQWARSLSSQVYLLYYCARDSRTPWYAKALIALVVGYALSPIDLIPDFIPVIGYLDDLLIVPIGVYLALKMIPKNVVEESRQRAAEKLEKPAGGRVAAFIIIAIWTLVAGLVVFLILKPGRKPTH